jgi:hypothetical protein
LKSRSELGLTSPLGFLTLGWLGLAGTPGCILPLAPEFVEETRAPPFVVTARPAVGSRVSTFEGGFEVVVQDPNSTDDLHVRWVIDYPPFIDNLSRPFDVSKQGNLGPGQTNRHRVALAPNCLQHRISPTISQHRLMLLISDRPFEEMPAARNPEKVPPDAHLLQLVWMFDLDCS